MDIKTIEVQMLSPSPKTGIIREVLRSILMTLVVPEQKDLAEKPKALAYSQPGSNTTKS